MIYDAVQVLRRLPESGETSIDEGTREIIVPWLPVMDREDMR